MKVAVIGGGPAGLRAAEIAARGGAKVTLFEAMPSVGRKFLVAGRGGLNLTNAEPFENFVSRYQSPRAPADTWASVLGEFDAPALRKWAAGLGVETFVASTGRIYPRELKAAPLLRRWVQRLRDLGVTFAMRHRWTGLTPGSPLRLRFETQDGDRECESDAVILALGGGSWPQTGSNGRWTETLAGLGVAVTPLEPANCGWNVPWPESVLVAAEGKPLKNIAARAGEIETAGELLITRYGLEGGLIYQLGPALHGMPQPVLSIDFKPSSTTEDLVAKLGRPRGNLSAAARRRWRLGDAAFAVIEDLAAPEELGSAEALARRVKNCEIQLTGPRPLAEAISSAGGVRWSELDETLMISGLQGVFVAGEMIDWEAPTGGYLIQGCFATAARAARMALRWSARCAA